MIEQGKFDLNIHYLKKKIYYIIRRIDTNVGLFSNYIVFAGHIKYALQNGWLPVIDMKNYPNVYLEPQQVGKINAWEYYFCQPLGITLDEAYNGDNVILSNDLPPDRPHDGMDFFNNINNILMEWRMLVKLGLLKVQPTIYQEFLHLYNLLFAKEDRVLGVLMRGTDYVALKPPSHPIPPPVDVAMKTVQEMKDKWNCNKIFLATEDQNIVSDFKERFGNTCITINKPYIKYDGQTYIPLYHIKRKNDFFLSGKEYLMQMLILSKCNCFVTARCSGSVGVMMMAEKFDNTLAFDFGNYPSPPPA